MRRLAALCLAGCLLPALHAAAGERVCWRSTPQGSALEFTAEYGGQALAGHFSEFGVTVSCDAGTGAPVALAVTVSTGSADMDDDEANAELREPDWFDVGVFPVASYNSSQLRADGARLLASGDLELKGVKRPLALSFDWEQTGGAARLAGSVDLSRLAWNVGVGKWAGDADLADRVVLHYRVALVPAD